MKQLFYLIVILKISIFAQDSEIICDSISSILINPKQPVCHINVTAFKIYNDNDYYDLIFRIYIIADDSSFNQTINFTSEYEGYLCEFEFIDINLDGYVDIGIIGEGDISNKSYQYWIYNIYKKEFVLNRQFSSLYNPVINSEDSTVESFASSHFQALPVFERNKYKIYTDSLLLIERDVH